MPYTDADLYLRDFVEHTGDSGAYPLPVGNPASGVHNPRKSDFRAAMNGMVTDAASYVSAAEAVVASAALYTPAYFENFAAFWADETSWPLGYILNTRAEGWSFRVAPIVAADHHRTRPDGTKFYVEPHFGSVAVDAFGAVGDGVTDDTDAIRAAINSKYAVVFTKDQYRITGSLTLYDQKVHGRGKHAARAATHIICDGNFPCFINRPDYWVQIDLSDFFIEYTLTESKSYAENGQKMGFKFMDAPVPGTSNIGWPEFIRVTNFIVKDAWQGGYDNTGTYMAVFERCEARFCKHGFYKQFGTTHTWINCMVGGDGSQGGTFSETGFTIRNVLAPTLINCAADGLTPAGQAIGGAANFFESCQGITINGWDGEANNIGTVTTATRSYMHFVQSSGVINGFAGYSNKFTFSDGGSAWLILNDGGTLTFNGKTSIHAADLQYVGTGGELNTIGVRNGGKTFVQGGVVRAASGGSPMGSFALNGTGGSISYVASEIDGSIGGLAVNLDPVAAGLGGLGSVGMFLNISTNIVAEGDVVAGSTLIWCSTNANITGSDQPVGSWICLGSAAANSYPHATNPNCVSIFRRVL